MHRTIRCCFAIELAASVLTTSASAQAREDLTRALGAGVGRTITSAPSLDSLPWREVGRNDPSGQGAPRSPRALCWLGDSLVIADGSSQQLMFYTGAGTYVRSIGGRGTAPGLFAGLTIVRCGAGKTALLAADLSTHHVSFFNSAGTFLRVAPTPKVPQIDILGEFALASDGSWFDSWLGTDVPFGPYLTDEEWQSTRLIRRYGPDDKPLGEFGAPPIYSDRVARRVLNRVFFAPWRDTLWTLTQGDATIRGFTIAGGSAPRPVRLPVYYRGAEPKVEIGEGHAGSPFLPNSMTFDPNVAGLAIVSDSLFAIVHYREWGTRMVGPGLDLSLRHIANSSIEVVDRRGRVVRAFDAPGFVLAVASDGRLRFAILTQMKDRTSHVLLARLPL